jgi:hypothetical protein
MRENELTINQTHQDTGAVRGVQVSNTDNTMSQNNNNIVGVSSNNNIILGHRESSLAEYSNFNFNPYSEFTGNNLEVMSESAYLNRNFESHLDEIFDNLTYLITTEK